VIEKIYLKIITTSMVNNPTRINRI